MCLPYETSVQKVALLKKEESVLATGIKITAIWFFCILSIEKLNIQSRFVGDFLGTKYAEYATRKRRRVNKMLATDDNILKQWVAYRNHINKLTKGTWQKQQQRAALTYR